MYKFRDTTPISIAPTTVSGSTVTIDNIEDVLGVNSLVVNIEPVQSGSGTPSPSNVRTINGKTEIRAYVRGKNLTSPNLKTATNAGITYKVNADGSITINGTATALSTFNLTEGTGFNHFAKGETYKFKTNGDGTTDIRIQIYSNGAWLAETSHSVGTFTLPANSVSDYARLRIGSGTTVNNVTIYPIITKNADVISDWAEPKGEDYVAELGQTVYGGTLDMISGLLTVDRVMVDLGSFTWVKDATYKRFYTYGLEASIKPASSTSTAFSGISDSLETVSFSAGYTDTTKDTCIFLSASKYVNIRWLAHEADTVAQFKTAVTGKKLVYELATPRTYLVSPQDIQLIAGDNNVYANSGNVSVTYAVDLALYKNLPTEAVSINGRYLERIIDGYRTLYVQGRESLAVSLDTYSVGTADGERLRNRRYPARELKVGFQLIADTAEEFRQRFNQLNNILSIEEADFIFNDERDKFFSGNPIMDAELETGTNSVKGEWSIYCTYPFKRSLEPITLTSTDDAVVSGNTATFTFNYGGVIPAKPVLRCEFASAKSGGDYNEDGDCGYVAFLDADENIIQLGNPDVIDLDATNKNATLINSTFDSLTGWTASGISTSSITDPQWNNGAGQTDTYATGVGSLSRSFTGALNFEWDMVHRLAVSDPAQTGSFKALMLNGNTVVVGYVIEKTGNGTAGTVRYVINNNTVGKDTIDLSLYNPSFGYCNKVPVYVTEEYYVWVKKGKKKKKVKKTRQVQKGWEYSQSNLNSGISRNGGSVTFSIGNLADRTFKRSDIDTATITSVKIETTGTLGTNAIRSASLISKKGVAFNQIPNVFTAGDIVEADCNDANVYLYRKGSAIGHLEPQYGALGNDWEDFEISVGTNIIRAVWSPWVNASYKPVIKIIFNEVFI